MYDEILYRARALALTYLSTADARHVGTRASRSELHRALGGALPAEPNPAIEVIERLAAAADPGIVATVGPRYFGFVTGGVHPAALAADWLVSAWDQNPCLYVLSPAASVIEDVAAAWILEALGFPAHASVGFTTGAQMANMTGLAAARHHVLRRAGWDVEAQGLQGARARHRWCRGTLVDLRLAADPRVRHGHDSPRCRRPAGPDASRSARRGAARV